MNYWSLTYKWQSYFRSHKFSLAYQLPACFSFALPRIVTGSQNSRHFLVQLEATLQQTIIRWYRRTDKFGGVGPVVQSFCNFAENISGFAVKNINLY